MDEYERLKLENSIQSLEDAQVAFGSVLNALVEVKGLYQSDHELYEECSQKLDEISAFLEEHGELLMGNLTSQRKELEAEVRSIKSYVDAVVADIRTIKGEPGEPGKDGSPDTPDEVRDKLESLKGDKRLDVSAIRGLDKKGFITKAMLERAIAILDQRTSYLVTKKASAYITALADTATIVVNDESMRDNGTTTYLDILLTASRTMGAPVYSIDGKKVIFRIKQGGSGSNTVTWNAAYRFSGGTAPTLTTTVGKVDYIGFIYNAASAKWDGVAVSLNF